MTSVQAIASRPAAWLDGAGDDGGIVVSTRVRLARNIAGQRFSRTLPERQQADLVNELLSSVPVALDWTDPVSLDLTACSDAERQVLFERRHRSRELGADGKPAGLVIAADERAAVMLNEEDHLRLQTVAPGADAAAALSNAIALDRALEQHFEWATDDRLGYLTSCPTNVGTGLRVGVMLHLPALVESREITKMMAGLSKLSLVARGFFGEGTQATGHFHQISNQHTLGASETAITEGLVDAVASLVQYEQLAREALLDCRRSHLEDRVWRAWGLLTNARRLSSDELIDQLSWIRLGCALELLPAVSWSKLDELLVLTQPGHLQVVHGASSAADERDALRAAFVRRSLTS